MYLAFSCISINLYMGENIKLQLVIQLFFAVYKIPVDSCAVSQYFVLLWSIREKNLEEYFFQ